VEIRSSELYDLTPETYLGAQKVKDLKTTNETYNFYYYGCHDFPKNVHELDY